MSAPTVYATRPGATSLKTLSRQRPLAEGRPCQRRAAQAWDIQVLFVVQGCADADVRELRRGGRGHKDASEEDLQTNSEGEPRLWMLSAGVRYRSP